MGEFMDVKNLSNYDLLDDLPSFFATINNVSDQYMYISATERRCFNLVALYLPALNNMVSNSGLLLQYKELVDYYIAHNSFPSILIVDDIMIHGRGVAKFLCQLENLLIEELTYRNLMEQLDDYNRFRRSFDNAVDIYVYAKNRGTLFLSDRYIQKIKCWKSLFSGKLRDLSMQLSDKLSKWEIANTSFVCSVRSNTLTNFLLKQDIVDVPDSNNDWVQLSWKYAGENMRIFIRLYGDNSVKRISTLRFFPKRGKTNEKKTARKVLPPQITSFSILGDIPEEMLKIICADVSVVLKNFGFTKLCDILVDDKKVLRHSQSQLICFIVSILDFWDFCSSKLDSEHYQQVKEELMGDLNKIACNFGRKNDIRPELNYIAASSALQAQLRNTIYPLLMKTANPLIRIRPSDYTYVKESDCKQKAIIESIASLFYQIGAKAEMQAFMLNKTPNEFNANTYQEYSDDLGFFSEDGVITVRNLEDYWKANNSIYSNLAAFIALMDRGIMSIRYHFIDNPKNGSRCTMLAKSGELALFYLPQKISLFIPAFAIIEENCYGIGQTLKDSVLRFLSQELIAFVSSNDTDLKDSFSQNEIKSLKERAQFELEALDHLRSNLQTLYQCGHSCRGWNFENLTHQNNQILAKFQKFLEDRARNFVRPIINDSQDSN